MSSTPPDVFDALRHLPKPTHRLRCQHCGNMLGYTYPGTASLRLYCHGKKKSCGHATLFLASDGDMLSYDLGKPVQETRAG